MAANTNSTELLRGIDVSRYQLMINWDTMKDDNISFAFIKATEGAYLKDSYFARNWVQSQKHGIKRGAYHFYLPWVDAKAQVDHFTSQVSLSPGDLAPVLDIETFAPDITDEELREGIRTWLTLAEQHYGVKPIIYTNQTYYNRKLKGHFTDYPFWIAKYHHTKPTTHPEDKMHFWQYSERGRLRGIDGAVDMNYFYGGMAALETLCVPANAPSEQLAQAEEELF
ncbi:glycoside hydrolase family 25 protein [Rufibacter roseus]|nr:GH25 family lysozyme [Rufibacter roseus]